MAAKGPGRATVTVVHSKLADAAAAGDRKAFWQERLGVLTSFLEDDPGDGPAPAG